LDEPVGREQLHDREHDALLEELAEGTAEEDDEPAHRRGEGIDADHVAEVDAGGDERSKADKEQPGHLEPLRGAEAHTEQGARQVQEGQREQSGQVGCKDLGDDLSPGPQRRVAQRTDLALGPVAGDAGVRVDGSHMAP
jgi:hypothetical protein